MTLPNGQTLSFAYDALDRRVSQVISGETTTFQYDGTNVVIDRMNNGGAVDHLSGGGVDDTLRQVGGGSGTLYHLRDHLGSTAALTNSSGGLLEQQAYESFGVNAGSIYTRYGYTGRERETLTGLMYYRARWYDPKQGRFLTEDPIEHSGGSNFYSYTENNPSNMNDPTGLYGKLLYHRRTAVAKYGTHKIRVRIGGVQITIRTKRPVSMRSDETEALMVHSHHLTGSSPKEAPQLPPGVIESAAKAPSDDRGHIIGAQLGGPGTANNLFWQNRGINRGKYRSLEDDIRKHIDSNQCDKCVLIVHLQYSDRGRPFRASSIVYGVQCESGFNLLRIFGN